MALRHDDSTVNIVIGIIIIFFDPSTQLPGNEKNYAIIIIIIILYNSHKNMRSTHQHESVEISAV